MLDLYSSSLLLVYFIFFFVALLTAKQALNPQTSGGTACTEERFINNC